MYLYIQYLGLKEKKIKQNAQIFERGVLYIESTKF